MGLKDLIGRYVSATGKTAYDFKDTEVMGNYKVIDTVLPSYNKDVLDVFLALLPRQKDVKTRVLDLAAGTGGQAQYMQDEGVSVVHSDLSTASVVYNKLDRHADLVVQNTMWNLPFTNNIFSGIHVKDAYVHVVDKQQFFAELSRVLIPGGIVCITTETGSSLLLDVVRTLGTTSVFLPVNIGKMIQIAKKEHLDLLHERFWKPGKSERDWYGRPKRERSVFFFRKTAIESKMERA